MDWSQPIDYYCERVGASLGAEPLNLVSNAAFFVALVLAVRQWRRLVPRPWPRVGAVMFALLAAIGVGSSLFHSFANRWAELADVIPIGLFVLVAWGVVMRSGFGWSVRGLVVGYIFLATASAAGFLLPAPWFNGSNGYFGAAATLGFACFWAHRGGLPAWRRLAGALVVFAMALLLRSIDLAVCDSLPIGSHFLWHIGVAGVAYQLMMVTAVLGGGPRARGREDGRDVGERAS